VLIHRIFHCFALYPIGYLCVLITSASVVAQETDTTVVLFLGNSLTSGHGLPVHEAYPAQLQIYVDSLQWPVVMVNAGVSGDTSTGGVSRLSWLLERPPDILVIALGSNDGLRGLPPSLTKSNLISIIKQSREVNPTMSIVVAGMQVPPNMGTTYQEEFKAIFPSVASEMNTELIPFLLEGVGGATKLNQSDGIHPTADGQRVIAETVWRSLYPVLQKHFSR